MGDREEGRTAVYKMIQKPVILITSLGRTGTKFFATLFQSLISHSTSLHEPDVFGVEQNQGASDILRQIKEAGWVNMFVGKALGKWSTIELSDKRIRGELDLPNTAHRLLEQRSKFVGSKPGTAYIESNPGFYGLIDVCPHVFAQHRIAFMIRDGRSWVRSWMNWGHLYAKGPVRRIIAHTWPTAAEIKDDLYHDRWSQMSRFERICWAWATLNQYALDTLALNPNAHLFYFEEIFKADARYENLYQLVHYLTDLPAVEPVAAAALTGWLDQQIHPSQADFPAWQNWSLTHKQQFEQICGPLMRQVGYF